MVDIIKHAKRGYCPHPDGSRFVDVKQTCPRCGGAHYLAACPIPADATVEGERRRTRQGGCCGQPSVTSGSDGMDRSAEGGARDA
jgi:hypothetical protein